MTHILPLSVFNLLSTTADSNCMSYIPHQSVNGAGVCRCADSFQAYCQSALAFSIKRGGILYGTGVQPLEPQHLSRL